MIKEAFLEWFRTLFMGIGCSLLAAGLVMFAMPGTPPMAFALSFVFGFLSITADLVLMFAMKIAKLKAPSNKE